MARFADSARYVWHHPKGRLILLILAAGIILLVSGGRLRLPFLTVAALSGLRASTWTDG